MAFKRKKSLKKAQHHTVPGLYFTLPVVVAIVVATVKYAA